MRHEAKKRQREDRRLNIWRKNKCFPAQFGSDEETPEAKETLEFWMGMNNKADNEGLRNDEAIQDALLEMKTILRWRRCRWEPSRRLNLKRFLRCTAPWKACGVDSVCSFPNKKCQPIKKAISELVKKMVEWKVADTWDEENNWHPEGRTVLIFKGGNRKDSANYRPITCLPTITKMVTLAFHKRMRTWLFGIFQKTIHECEQRGVRSSQGCKEVVIENLASNIMKKRRRIS